MKSVLIACFVATVMATSVAARDYKFALLTPERAATLHTRMISKAVPPNTTLNSVFDTTGSVVLGLQQCNSGGTWTIHGLWASQNYCSGAAFSQSAIQDLWPTLEQYWMSCPQYGDSEAWFLSHEWTKHGTCFSYSEHGYFSETLQIYLNYGWQSQCEGQSGSCDVEVTLA